MNPQTQQQQPEHGAPESTEDFIFGQMDLEEHDTQSAGTQNPDDTTQTQSHESEPERSTTQEGTAEDARGGTESQQAAETVPEQQQQQPELKAHPVHKEFFVDANGNVTDRNGSVVAETGRERRWFEQAASLHEYLSHQREQYAAVQQQLRDALQGGKEALNGMPARLGLAPDEVDLGLNLAAGFKRDPIAVAKYVLAETLKLGHNLSEIVGEQGSNSVDVRAIKALLDERLGGVATARTEQQAHEQAERSAREQFNAFDSRFPDARPHHDAIARIMQDHKMPATEAYFQLRQWATAQGLDWSQPLGPQVQARMHAQPLPAQQQQQQQQQPSPRAPLPNGGTPHGGVTDTPAFGAANDDFDDIIAVSMREAGMRN